MSWGRLGPRKGQDGRPHKCREGAWPCDTLSLDFRPPHCGRRKFWFVALITVVPGESHDISC